MEPRSGGDSEKDPHRGRTSRNRSVRQLVGSDRLHIGTQFQTSGAVRLCHWTDQRLINYVAAFKIFVNTSGKVQGIVVDARKSASESRSRTSTRTHRAAESRRQSQMRARTSAFFAW